MLQWLVQIVGYKSGPASSAAQVHQAIDMITKSALLVLVCTVAYAAGNPAAGVEWRWKSRVATVSPNVRALPFEKLLKTYKPVVRIPGTKTVENCGLTTPATSRIVGGSEVIPHSYPHLVGLFVDDIWFCGGSIISEDWVLTAAHCMDGASSVEVVAGAHNLQLNEASQVSQFSTDFFVHENWFSYYLNNDVALIRMNPPITFTSEIAPVCLPSRSDKDLPAGTLVTPSGWGSISDSYPYITDIMRHVTVPVDDRVHCINAYGSAVVTDSVICIDSTGGKGTCSGDSGGPMNYVVNRANVLRGVVSFGSTTGCETGWPNGFSRVTSFLDWIETKTGIAMAP